MLDQNTDRMWFVIGAVIVGAAIIFIANGTLPTLFASVSDSFEESAHKGTELIGEIHPMSGINLLAKYSHIEMTGGHVMETDGSIRALSNQFEYVRFADIAPIIDQYGLDQSYRIEFEMKSLDPSNFSKTRVYMQNGTTTKYVMADGQYKMVDVTTEFQHYVLEDITFIETKHDTDRAHLDFFGGDRDNYYGNGNVPVVRNVKLFLE